MFSKLLLPKALKYVKLAEGKDRDSFLFVLMKYFYTAMWLAIWGKIVIVSVCFLITRGKKKPNL